jgi:hypothetical protein
MRDYRRLRRRTEGLKSEMSTISRRAVSARGVRSSSTTTGLFPALALCNGVLELRGTGVKPRLPNLVSVVSITSGGKPDPKPRVSLAVCFCPWGGRRTQPFVA